MDRIIGCPPVRAKLDIRYKLPATNRNEKRDISDIYLTQEDLKMERSKKAPHQHTQPSRKGKKAWRKNVDVSDVQAGLEEARDELING